MGLWKGLLGSEPNKNYYRQYVTYEVLQGFFAPVRFWLKNRGGVGGRDLYINMKVESRSSSLVVVAPSQIPTTPPSTQEGSFSVLGSSTHVNKPEEIFRKTGNSWSTHIEVRALQPQRELSPPVQLLIGAQDSCEVIIGARIYADTLPEPVYQELRLHINVSKISVSASDVVHDIPSRNRIGDLVS